MNKNRKILNESIPSRKNNIPIETIDVRLEKEDMEGNLPKTEVTILRHVEPSKLNAGETGEQKTITMDEERMLLSAGSQKYPLKKAMFPEMIQTVVPAKILAAKFEMQDKGHIKEYYSTLLKVFEKHMFKKGLAYLLSENDYTGIYEKTKSAISGIDDSLFIIEKGKESPDEKIVDAIKRVCAEFDYFNSHSVVFGSLFSDFCTSEKMENIHGGFYISHAWGVTPHMGEQNYISKTEDYNLIDSLRLAQDRGAKLTGSCGNYLNDMNSAIIIQQYAVCPRSVLRVLMRVVGGDIDESWEKALEIYNANNAEIFRLFSSVMPVGGQHSGMAMARPSATLLRFTTGQPYTVGDHFARAIRGEDAMEQAINRLLRIPDMHNYDDPLDRMVSYYNYQDYDYLKDIYIPKDAVRKTQTEMYRILLDGVVLKN